MARKNHQLAHAAINKAVFDQWATDPPWTLVAPGHANSPPDSGDNYAIAHVMAASTTNRALGSTGDHLRGQGVVKVQVFVRKGTGTLDAQKAADVLDPLGNTQIQSLDGGSSMWITFRAVGPATFSSSEEGYKMFVVEIPFHWDSSDARTFVPA